MSGPINLNKARKARAKADQKTQADANAVKHGRTKTERLADEKTAAKAAKSLDGHKREP